MTTPGRKKDPIWEHFIELPLVLGRKGVRAQCKHCSKEMQGLVVRLKEHYRIKCSARSQKEESDDDGDVLVGVSGNEKPQGSTDKDKDITIEDEESNRVLEFPKREEAKRIKLDLDSFVVRTSSYKKQELDEKVARFIYSANCPFRLVENKEFIEFCEKARPGYKPPTRANISGKHLDKVFSEESEKCVAELKGKYVCMALDGWSNIKNQPIICACVIKQGEVFLVDTVDTSGNSHTSAYLSKLAIEIIGSAEKKYLCKISSFVTDNAYNMAAMRSDLEEGGVVNVLTYGCSAHLLNLLAKDLFSPQVFEHVVQIHKFFRNHHLPKAWYNAEGGTELIIPFEVRWNTYYDCLVSYVKNWGKLAKICEEHREEKDMCSSIRNKVMNINIKRTAEDMIEKLKPIAIALDRVQKNSCSLAECLLQWKLLGNALKNNDKAAYKLRYNQAVSDFHFSAFLLSPKMLLRNEEKEEEDKDNISLNNAEKEKGLKYIETNCSANLIATCAKFQAKIKPFDDCTLLKKKVVDSMTDDEWWKAFFTMSGSGKEKDTCLSLNKNEMKFIYQLTTAVASTAGIERLFSNFGIVQSKLRNQLGTEKAAKLVFLMKQLNKNK